MIRRTGERIKQFPLKNTSWIETGKTSSLYIGRDTKPKETVKVLIVDNNLHLRGYPQGWVVRGHLGVRHTPYATIREPEKLSERDNGPDRVILTGSTAFIRQEHDWMYRERTFIDAWMKRGIPILGICFGAQLLARHLFGKKAITALPYPINGSIQVRYKEGTELFE